MDMCQDSNPAILSLYDEQTELVSMLEEVSLNRYSEKWYTKRDFNRLLIMIHIRETMSVCITRDLHRT